MERAQQRVLVALHADLVTKAGRLRRAAARRDDPESEVMGDEAMEAEMQAEAIEAALIAAGADVDVPQPGQLSLLSLGDA